MGDNALGSICLSVCLDHRGVVGFLVRSNTRFHSNKSHYQSMVFVCMSVISGRMQMIGGMGSIGF